MTGPARVPLDASATADAIRSGRVTSEDVVQACLDRIADREPTVLAWAHLDRDAALAQARARDRQAPRGPLHGVPVAVKDLIDTADAPTAYGSPIYAGHRPDRDATCVARLRSAGAVVLGKTVTTEFALFHPGPTTNPLDPTRTPGGSSSGSAAAVAAGMVPLALGTQTAGSVIRPASFCGIFGCKPTYGAVPTTGVKMISPTLDTVGLLSRSARDLALGLSVLSGAQVEPPGVAPRLGFARTHDWHRAEPATQQAILDAAERLDLPELALPDAFAALVDAQSTIMDAEAARHLARERREHPDLLSAPLRERLDRGAQIDEPRVRAAAGVAALCRGLLDDLFAEVDALVVPSVLGEASVGLHATGDPRFCRMWTLLGTPAVAVPGLLGPDSLPLGIQVVAAPGADGTAIAAAAWLAPRLDGTAGREAGP